MKDKKEYYKQWYMNNQEHLKKYRKQYRQSHKEVIKDRDKAYYEDNKLEILKRFKEKYSTQLGRANELLKRYNLKDLSYNRGKGDLTPEWIVDNIFSKPCTHCGESDWHKIGCNRLDNSKPHTMDNVEPCCAKCNIKLCGEYNRIRYSKQVYQYTLDGELVKVWSSVEDTSTEGFNPGAVAACSRGGYKSRGKWINIKQHKGYRWSYTPL